jgi:hypothetical protein
VSAYINPPKGYAFLVFEIHEDGGLRFISCVPRSTVRRKVIVKAKVQPLRKTKGADHLVIYCVPIEPTAEAVRQFVAALLAVINGMTERIMTSLQPLIGMPINEETKAEAVRLLADIHLPIPSIRIDLQKEVRDD